MQPLIRGLLRQVERAAAGVYEGFRYQNHKAVFCIFFTRTFFSRPVNKHNQEVFGKIHSTAKPAVSSTACFSLSCSRSLVGYGGRSSRLKQVCALGSESGEASATRCSVKRRGAAAPVEPCNARKPASGTRRDPVTN